MIKIEKNANKSGVFFAVKNWLKENGFEIASEDDARPWGGFFVISEEQIDKFRKTFFPEVSFSESQLSKKLSPKILMVAPKKRLSWQYHFRRAEIWKLVGGKGGIITSETDEEGPLEEMKTGEVVSLNQGQRHRLVGLDDWGIVAEIWMHTDPTQPSNEDDIVRVQDDFQRN
ncbi:cupin domain-containing protein [Pleomorphovibrio marinus]|uniref:phosphoheptose isomerase n=1 Tax=Pleomorphovibrio marinus TaxID=2164132 RepID=UPI000E0AF854|nr:phosphoheptose isomerase [Pleomorphovibrio marinus]